MDEQEAKKKTSEVLEKLAEEKGWTEQETMEAFFRALFHEPADTLQALEEESYPVPKSGKAPDLEDKDIER